MSLLYVTLDRYSKYSVYSPVGPDNNGGGMGEKTLAAAEVWKSLYPMSVSQELIEGFDILVVEPLWFRIRGGNGSLTIPDLEKSVEQYENYLASIKVLYTSETSLMKIPATYRNRIIEASNIVTHNCLFQRDQFRSMGITTEPLCDIVTPDFFYYPDHKKELSIVALGRISTDKNSQVVADVFKGLEGKGIKRIYIGSSDLWGMDNQEDAKIEEEIAEWSDELYRNIPHIRIGRILSKSTYGMFDSFHDCSATSNQQALMAGILCFYGLHGLWRERPGVHGLEGAEAFIEAIEKHSEGFTKIPSNEAINRIEQYAMSQFSPLVFEEQWGRIIQKCKKNY